MGIVIKAFGKNVEPAFEVFKKHQRWLLAVSAESEESPSIFSKSLDEQEHNDITFGCLVDVLVRSGQV